jgi:hypothetical protein
MASPRAQRPFGPAYKASFRQPTSYRPATALCEQRAVLCK